MSPWHGFGPASYPRRVPKISIPGSLPGTILRKQLQTDKQEQAVLGLEGHIDGLLVLGIHHHHVHSLRLHGCSGDSKIGQLEQRDKLLLPKKETGLAASSPHPGTCLENALTCYKMGDGHPSAAESEPSGGVIQDLAVVSNSPGG